MTQLEKAEAVVAGLRDEEWCEYCQRYVEERGNQRFLGMCFRCFWGSKMKADKFEAKRHRDTWKTTTYGHF